MFFCNLLMFWCVSQTVVQALKRKGYLFLWYLFIFYETTLTYVNHDEKHLNLKVSLLIKFSYDLNKCTYFFLKLVFCHKCSKTAKKKNNKSEEVHVLISLIFFLLRRVEQWSVMGNFEYVNVFSSEKLRTGEYQMLIFSS